jgi:membrane fusion protein (multidrug efflux system)
MRDEAKVDAAAAPAGAQGPGSKIQSGMRKRRLWLMIGAPVVALGALGWFYFTSGRFEATDNAYVQAARLAVSTSVTGRITELRVAENQHVERGQVLFVLDNSRF